MRAIESLELQAHRDNKNQWRIDEDVLAQWARIDRDQHQSHADTQTNPPQNDGEVLLLRELLAAEQRRADAAERARDQAEQDRDRWHTLATRRWWHGLLGRRD